MIKLIKRAVNAIAYWNAYKVRVVSVDFPGQVVEHVAADWQDAVDWMRQYPVTDAIVVGRRGMVVAERSVYEVTGFARSV